MHRKPCKTRPLLVFSRRACKCKFESATWHATQMVIVDGTGATMPIRSKN